MTRARSAGIPRLQEVDFLRIAAEQVDAGATYDQVRRALIEHMAAERERTQPSGNHAALRLARHDEHRYMNNATDALAELMRLGLVQSAQLPTTRKAAPVYAARTFGLTPEGRAWVDLLGTDRRAAFDDLLRLLWDAHPQLAGFLRLLRKGTFTIPGANWREVHRERVGPEGREPYIRFLAARTSRAIEAGVTGWDATEDETAQAIRDYINERMDADVRRQRPDRYLRNSDFVGACEEALVSFAFSRAGLRLDYISLEILRRWTKHLGVANFSYHVPAPPALRLWVTAELEEDEHGRLTRITRRTVGEWGDRVIDELQPAFELTRNRYPRSDSFVSIYQVRAGVCSKLGLNDTVFDASVGEFLAGKRRTDASFRMHSDSAEYGSTPPTETPLRVHDAKTGQTLTYRVMTLIPR
jgi:hypothetical protein